MAGQAAVFKFFGRVRSAANIESNASQLFSDPAKIADSITAKKQKK
jgi:hypothetical protein